jgi:hypothetical protein
MQLKLRAIVIVACAHDGNSSMWLGISEVGHRR